MRKTILTKAQIFLLKNRVELFYDINGLDLND